MDLLLHCWEFIMKALNLCLKLRKAPWCNNGLHRPAVETVSFKIYEDFFWSNPSCPGFLWFGQSFFFFNCVRQSRFFFSLWGLGFSLFLPSIRNRWQRPRAPTHWRPPKHVTRPRSIEVNNMWKHWSSLCPLSIPFNHLSKVNIQSWLVRQQAFGAQWKNQEEMGDDGEEMTQRDRVLSFTGFGGREGGRNFATHDSHFSGLDIINYR